MLIGCSDPDHVPETHISAPPTLSPTFDVKRYPPNRAVRRSTCPYQLVGRHTLQLPGSEHSVSLRQRKKIELPTGDEAQLKTPLDFVALADHAEGFEVQLPCTMLQDSPEFDQQQCRDLRSGNFDVAAMLAQAFSTAGARLRRMPTIFVVMMHAAKLTRSIRGSGYKPLLTRITNRAVSPP